MPEIKKVFMQGKMNQDLDERIVPQGEYREAQNIQIASSEDSDVGAIENVLGNKLAYETSLVANDVGDEVIGAYSDTTNNRIFWFTTDFSVDTNASIVKMARGTGQDHAVIMKDGTAEPVVLISGNFLNFNKLRKITGVNVIENHLYWTDNYNQPRSIDLTIADPGSTDYVADYYDCEEKIAAAKIAPYKEPLLNETNIVIGTGAFSRGDGTTLLRDGDVKSKYMEDKFIRFAYRYKFHDGQYSIISPFTQSVFKPLNASILKYEADETNATAANTGTGDEPKVPVSVENVWEDTIAAIMQNAYNKVTMRIPIPNIDEHLIGSATGYDPGSTYTNPFKIDSIEILIKESDGLAIKVVDIIDMNDVGIDIESYYAATTSENVTVNGAITAGAAILVDETVSNIAAGWTIDNMSTSVLGATGRAYVTNVAGAPTTITLDHVITIGDGVTLTFKKAYYRQAIKYTYTAKEPYRVLPSKQLIRVSDKIPVRAKAQELVSNRIVYGNITQNYSLPKDTNNKKGIDYTIAHDFKGDAEFGQTVGYIQDNDQQYKYHNIKQRRTYQVGIVLSDRYGRQSPVLLSTHSATDLSDTVTVGANADDFSAKFSSAYSWSASQAAYGQALTITFQDDIVIPDNDIFTQVSNPHGWYSWRLVVKQTEQDYYNVYTNHPANSWTTKGITTTASNTISGAIDITQSGRSWLTLYGDNINKVPRSIKASDETRPGIAGSEVRLYPKIVEDSGSITYKSKMGHIDQEYINVISIGSGIEQGLASDANTGDAAVPRLRVYSFVRDSDKNPMVAELPNLRTEQVAVGSSGDVSINSSAVGSGSGTAVPAGYPNANNDGLSVFETEPVKSHIDIYYETSTGGLLYDIQEQVKLQSAGPTNVAVTPSSITFTENDASGTHLANLSATATSGSITAFTLVAAVDGNEDSHVSSFTVYDDSGTWKLKTNSTFWFNNLAAKDVFTLTIRATQSDGTTTNADFTVTVTNFQCIIGSGTGTIPSGSGSGVSVGSVQAYNGSANGTMNQKFLTPVSITDGAGGSVISGLELTQPSDGTMRVVTASGYDESALFGSGTTKTVNMNIIDNGGLTDTDEMVITLLEGFTTSGFASPTEAGACNLKCIASSFTVYIAEGTGSEPSNSGLHYGNIVYTDPAMTTRLYAGTVGWFVWSYNNHAWYVSNGVLNTDNGVCDPC